MKEIELKPCWKCGGEAYQWQSGAVCQKGLVTCDCMPIDENYTVDEWQNHPRGEPVKTARVIETPISIKVKGKMPDGSWSELAGWIPENNHPISYESATTFSVSNPSKKKSWLQKIRGYDDLQARVQSAEAMRDHYKTQLESWKSLSISKARDLERMTKVADNCQAKLVEVNEKYTEYVDEANKRLDKMEEACQLLNEIMDEEEKAIGRRLKFSVGTCNFTIVVGNPVTACYFIDTENEDEFLSVSICHKNDTYNWKRGVIESVENMAKNWLGTAYCDRTEMWTELFKKYPALNVKQCLK